MELLIPRRPLLKRCGVSIEKFQLLIDLQDVYLVPDE